MQYYSKRIQLYNYLSELEFEVALSVEDLDAVVVGVGHHDLVVRGHRHPAWFGELPSEDAELAELAVVDHLLALDVRLWGVDYGWRWHWDCHVRDELAWAGGEEIGHAEQVEGVRRHVVVLEIVEVIETPHLVNNRVLQFRARLHSKLHEPI